MTRPQCVPSLSTCGGGGGRGDPPPTHPCWWQRRWKAMQVLFRSCTTCYKHQHTSLQTSGGWVVVVGRRCRGVLSMWCPLPPPTQTAAAQYTAPGPATAVPSRALPGRRPAGEQLRCGEVGGNQCSRDTNANSRQLFGKTQKVVESC